VGVAAALWSNPGESAILTPPLQPVRADPQRTKRPKNVDALLVVDMQEGLLTITPTKKGSYTYDVACDNQGKAASVSAGQLTVTR
jgi:hypothetical protein